MFCSSCGYKLSEDEDKFCPVCGELVDQRNDEMSTDEALERRIKLFGILSIVFSLTCLGLIFGIIGMNMASKAKKEGIDNINIKKGRKLSLIGLVLYSSLMIISLLMTIVVAIVL